MPGPPHSKLLSNLKKSHINNPSFLISIIDDWDATDEQNQDLSSTNGDILSALDMQYIICSEQNLSRKYANIGYVAERCDYSNVSHYENFEILCKVRYLCMNKRIKQYDGLEFTLAPTQLRFSSRECISNLS